MPMHKFSSTKQDLTNCIFVYQIFEYSKFDQIHFIQQYMNYSLVDCSIYQFSYLTILLHNNNWMFIWSIYLFEWCNACNYNPAQNNISLAISFATWNKTFFEPRYHYFLCYRFKLIPILFSFFDHTAQEKIRPSASTTYLPW